METVLVVGASGNIGVSTIIAALRSGRNVLAVVRNKAAKEKITKNVPDVSKVTFVEADVVNENGVQGVVDQVKAGELPAFQHVYGAGAQRLISANFKREVTN
jgi:NAD(P)-dependent dehydrogenase (short-subunit alcohol dehydrogenase family)